MGLSLWHVILVLVIVLVPLGSAALAIRVNKTSTLSRMKFAVYIGAFVITVVLGEQLLDSFSPGFSTVRIAAGVGLLTLAPALLAYWCVSRMRHAGIRKIWLALLSTIPLVGIFFILYLAFAQPQPAAAATMPA